MSINEHVSQALMCQLASDSQLLGYHFYRNGNVTFDAVLSRASGTFHLDNFTSRKSTVSVSDGTIYVLTRRYDRSCSEFLIQLCDPDFYAQLRRAVSGAI